MERTCKSCGDTFTWVSARTNSGGRPAQYCSDKCRKQMPVPCAVCGTVVVRSASHGWRKPAQLVACSNECRAILRPGNPGLRSALPDDHPARWAGQATGVAYAHCKLCHALFACDARWPRVYCSAHSAESRPRFVSASCHDCGKPVMLDRQSYQQTGGYGHAYCGKACSRRASKRRRRAREHNAPGEFRWVDVIGLWLALDRCCAYCGAQSDKQPDPDHVIPLSRGGDNTIDNVLPACHPCNSQKRTLTIAEWTADRRGQGKPELPHPWRAMGWRRIEDAPPVAATECA